MKKIISLGIPHYHIKQPMDNTCLNHFGIYPCFYTT